MKKDKKITITGALISKVCSVIGIVCSVICLIFELINSGNMIVTWIVLLLCNISLFFSVQNNKNNQ